jgi:hypothetical protein
MPKILMIVEVPGGFILMRPSAQAEIELPLEIAPEDIHAVASELGESYDYPSDHIKSVLSITRQFFTLKENPTPETKTP